jgi:OOP family OmpA-OmpF porin
MVLGMAFGCILNNADYKTTGPGGRLVHATLIVDPVPEAGPNVAKIREKVLFDFDSYKIDAAADATIEKVAMVMKQALDTQLVLAGHTDKYGADDYNATLSLNRANAVKAALVDEGIAADRIVKVEGLGKTQLLPKLTNRENRRVLILSFGD